MIYCCLNYIIINLHQPTIFVNRNNIASLVKSGGLNGKNTYNKKTILDKSREVIHAFIKREIESFQDLLDPYFVWLGDYSNQYIRGKEAFLETIKLESSLPPLDISQEEYAVLTHEKKTWITYGRFTVNAHGKDRELYSSKIHFTFVWKEDKDGLFLLHANACHVIDAQQQL